jgi:hypothetical protein
MARIPKAQKGYCTKGSNCRLVATGKFRSNEASSGGGRLTRSERKELEERNKVYDSPNYLIPSERKRAINYRKNRQVSELVETRRSTARRGIKIAKNGGKTPAWQRKEGKNPSGGLNAKGVASYRAANPGSKLKTAVTTKPSKLKPGSKAANRRKSFCARMSGMKKRLTSAKTANDPNSRINKSLRKWNC